MSVMNDLKSAAIALPVQEREELLLVLASSLREELVLLPPPRDFSAEEIQGWIADDESGMREFLANAPNHAK